ncbi:MAG: DUF423 domain-containing protein [Fidelibacterota bacterium]
MIPALGAFLAALAVILGAFGAHGLRDILSDAQMMTFHTAVQYQMYHALGMILTKSTPRLAKAGWLFLAGIVLFSGSLYLLILTDIKQFGMITPLGGILFIAGWTMMGVMLWKGRQDAA